MIMNQPAATAPAAHRDAWSRAVRTWTGGLITAVLVNLAPAALALTGSVRWTREYWTAEAILLGNLALSGAVSYVFRRLVPPKP